MYTPDTAQLIPSHFQSFFAQCSFSFSPRLIVFHPTLYSGLVGRPAELEYGSLQDKQWLFFENYIPSDSLPSHFTRVAAFFLVAVSPQKMVLLRRYLSFTSFPGWCDFLVDASSPPPFFPAIAFVKVLLFFLMRSFVSYSPCLPQTPLSNRPLIPFSPFRDSSRASLLVLSDLTLTLLSHMLRRSFFFEHTQHFSPADPSETATGSSHCQESLFAFRTEQASQRGFRFRYLREENSIHQHPAGAIYSP